MPPRLKDQPKVQEQPKIEQAKAENPKAQEVQKAEPSNEQQKNVRHPSLSSTVPVKTIKAEKWMDDIVQRNTDLMPPRLFAKILLNPLVFEAAAHTLRVLEDAKDCKRSTFHLALDSLDQFVSGKGFRDELLAKCWVPQLIEISKKTFAPETFEYQYYQISAGTDALSSLLLNPNFKEEWISKYWSPFLDFAFKNGQKNTPVQFLNAFSALFSSPNFKEEWFDGFFMPSIRKLAEVKEDEYERYSALYAFAALLSHKDFKQEWVSQYWDPIFENFSFGGAYFSAKIFSSLGDVFSAENFKEEHFSTVSRIFADCLIPESFNFLEKALKSKDYNEKSIEKFFLPTFDYFVQSDHFPAWRAFDHLSLFLMRGNPLSSFDGIVSQAESIIQKTAQMRGTFNNDITEQAITCFFSLANQRNPDEILGENRVQIPNRALTKNWINEAWLPLFNKVISEAEGGSAPSVFSVFSKVFESYKSHRFCLDEKRPEYIVPTIMHLAEITHLQAGDVSQYATAGIEDARNPFKCLGKLIPHINPKDYQFFFPALSKVVARTSGESTSTAIKVFNSLYVSGNLSSQALPTQLLDDMDKFQEKNPFQIAGFLKLYFCSEVQSQGTQEGRLSKLGRMLSTFSELGIENFHRYSEKVLEDIYLTATDPEHSKGKKVALIALNKNDHNDAFAGDINIYEKLLLEGYCLSICEADDENEVAERYFNYGKTADSRPSQLMGRNYDLVILGGHGKPWSINFGGPAARLQSQELGYIGFEDFSQSALWQKGAWATMLSGNADICLFSCSTGNEADINASQAGGPGNFQNMMQMIGFLAYKENSSIKIYAPKNADSTVDLAFENGRVKEIIRSSNSISNSYSPFNPAP